MIVVTDTSVILNLCAIGQQDLLRRLFDRVLAPTAVVAEFQRLALVVARFQGLTFPAFIQRAAPASLPSTLADSAHLQAGEIAALSLAMEKQADAVLMDELAGRAAASSLGLRTIGLLGILLDAKNQNLVPALAPLIGQLESDAGVWISASLRGTVLQAAGEAP